MKRIKVLLWSILGVVLLISLCLGIYMYSLKPQYEGEQELGQLNKNVSVYFDEYGVPHIYAETETDALRTLGYVHAQDRLWQMELLRRVAPGRLSEMFGNKTIKADRFFKTLGIDEISEKAVASLSTSSPEYKLAMAYLDGVNQYVEKGKTPLEFQILGIQKTPFQLKDIYNILGYMSFSFASAQKTDPLLTEIRSRLGNSYLQDFGIPGLQKFDFPQDKSKALVYSEMYQSINELMNLTPVPAFVGSNSWVLGPQKTKNGKVIFANDPHIGFSQPCVWYEAHIVTPEFENYGDYLAGVPFPLLGHNHKYAYGLTMFENDDIDFFQEKVNPENSNQYQIKNDFKEFSIHKKVIKVKDSLDYVVEVKSSIHGPVVNEVLDNLDQKLPVTMSWVFTQQSNPILGAVYGFSHAADFESFKNSISLIAAPGLNIMYGDAQGNVAWNTSGKLYHLPASVNSKFVLDGSNGVDDQKDFIDFSKNPTEFNPDKHYVFSANSEPKPVDGYRYPGYYLPQDRAIRIQELINPKNDWTKEEVSKMMLDNKSDKVLSIVQSWIEIIKNEPLSSDEKAIVKVLKSWNGTHRLDEIAPTIYNRWLSFYLKNTFEDELGTKAYEALLKIHILKDAVPIQSRNPKSVWWDNVKTVNVKETQLSVLSQSFHQAIADLKKELGQSEQDWTWDKVHTLEHEHALGKVPVLKQLLNVGIFPVAGTNEVINNMVFEWGNFGPHNVTVGPSTRRIIDFSDVDNSWSILPTGQSGNVMSSHYKDQAKMYVEGKFRKMKMNQKEIKDTSTLMIFKPSKKTEK